MAQGTNEEILGKGSKFKEVVKSTGGRPTINRDIVIRNIKLVDQLGNRRYTNAQIGRMMDCSSKTIGRIYKEALKNGDITEDEFNGKPIGVVEADFDSECERAKGLSFRAWLITKFKDKSAANSYFNFNSKVWNQIFDSCNLQDLANDDLPLGDQMAVKFITSFQDDIMRMRPRLKMIRFLFRFLGRGDINDRHLKMKDSAHPRQVRNVPEISQTNFGLLYQRCEDAMVERLGEEVRLMLRLKIVTQMRTGNRKDEREFYGIRKGSEGKSYLTMVSPDEYQFRVYAKKGERWDVIWMPREVKEALYEKYENMDTGEYFATISKQRFVKHWRAVTKEIMGKELILHDLRKISLTWLYVMGVTSEVAINLNVGWKDINTALSNYLDVKKVLRKSVRAKYRKNIPEWFKEGLDDFQGFEAVIGGN